MLQIYDRVVSSRSEETLLMLTGIVVFMFIVMGVLEILRSKILIRVGTSFDKKMSGDIFNLIFSYEKKYQGKSTVQPMNDLITIRQFLTGTPVFAFFDIPWIPIYLGIMFLFHPILGWFGIFASIISFSLTIINEKRTKTKLDDSNSSFQKSQSLIQKNLRNTEIIEAMGMQDSVKKRWNEVYEKFLKEQFYASEEASVWSNISKITRILMQSLILGVGGYLTITGEITAGMMIAGSILLGRALAPIDLMTSTWKQFVSTRASYKKLNNLIEEFSEEKEKHILPEPKGFIDVEKITVYPPESKVPSLNEISLSINAGETLALIGPSASGKSSLARSILGLWAPESGIVRIDGADIHHYDRKFLGSFLGYLPQDIELFEGTISENISRFEENSEEDVLKAASIAGVHEMILKLPEGYNTQIGVGGISLSGGQRQRIGLARAIFRFPKIVVLDEPNSNLDEVGERALMNAILELKNRKTTIILITHRLSVLDITDKIALIQEGQLKLFGEKEEIIKILKGQK